MKAHFDTLSIHAGAQADPTTGARQTPIYQTTSYQFKNSDHAANLFALKELGFIYSRLHNPTVSVLEQRVAALEGGIFGVATASGHAAQLITFHNLLQAGDEFVVAKKLYGGSLNQFTKSFKQFGWTVRFFDENKPETLAQEINEKTKLVFMESVTNPNGDFVDIESIATIAHKHQLPLIVDNTVATPYLVQPFKFGADIIIHSTTKFISGNGSSLGGIVIDSGKFNWQKDAKKFPLLTEPDSSYNNIIFSKAFGNLGFSVRLIAIGLRDLGCQQNAFNAFLTLNGLETLSLRLQKHSDNAKHIAEWLSQHPQVVSVSHPFFNPYSNKALLKKYAPNGASSVFTFTLKNASIEKGKKFIESLKLISHLANIGDTKTLIIHPSSTTHSQLSQEAKIAAGAGDNIIRLSIGIEHPKDIIADLEQAFKNIE